MGFLKKLTNSFKPIGKKLDNVSHVVGKKIDNIGSFVNNGLGKLDGAAKKVGNVLEKKIIPSVNIGLGVASAFVPALAPLAMGVSAGLNSLSGGIKSARGGIKSASDMSKKLTNSAHARVDQGREAVSGQMDRILTNVKQGIADGKSMNVHA
jgi:hypothetical protein